MSRIFLIIFYVAFTLQDKVFLKKCELIQNDFTSILKKNFFSKIINCFCILKIIEKIKDNSKSLNHELNDRFVKLSFKNEYENDLMRPKRKLLFIFA